MQTVTLVEGDAAAVSDPSGRKPEVNGRSSDLHSKKRGPRGPLSKQRLGKDEVEAERRRVALREFMAEHNIQTPTQLGQECGLDPNSIINFLKGHTASLSVASYERIASRHNVSINILIGNALEPSSAWTHTYIKGVIGTGIWLHSHLWPRSRWREIMVPSLPYKNTVPSVLETEEMNEVWPRGTQLQIVRLQHYKGDIHPGDKIIVIHKRPDGHSERWIREVTNSDDGEKRRRLIARSTDPAFRGLNYDIEWPPVPGRVEPVGQTGNTIEVYGVVIRTSTPFHDEVEM